MWIVFGESRSENDGSRAGMLRQNKWRDLSVHTGQQRLKEGIAHSGACSKSCVKLGKLALLYRILLAVR